jgi:peptide/nickel transport system permease protein
MAAQRLRFWIFLAKRLLAGFIMILVTASFTFFLVRLMPGNPIEARLNTLVSEGVPVIQATHEVQIMYAYMPKAPVIQQWGLYIWSILHFNLGQSITYEGVPVIHLIMAALPWTLILVLLGIIASFIIGIGLGVLAAVGRNSGRGQGITLFSTLMHGIPQFVLAVLLAYVFTTIWPIFPFGAPYSASVTPGFTFQFLSNLAYHQVLPVATYAISGFGGYALVMKASVVGVLGDDFILASEIRGISQGIRLKYIAHNAILPLFTSFTIGLGFVFGGSVFIERIFDDPGLGNLLLLSVNNSDYPTMQGAFLLITVAVIFFNVVADLMYPLIDPRIRQ